VEAIQKDGSPSQQKSQELQRLTSIASGFDIQPVLLAVLGSGGNGGRSGAS